MQNRLSHACLQTGGKCPDSCVGLARTVYIIHVYVYTPYMTVYLVIFLPKLPYMHRISMVLADPTHVRVTKVCTAVDFGWNPFWILHSLQDLNPAGPPR